MRKKQKIQVITQERIRLLKDVIVNWVECKKWKLLHAKFKTNMPSDWYVNV